MKTDQKKLRSLILYILQNYNNRHLTETKLQKLLYFSDFGYYQEYGKSLTYAVYHKNHFGPTIYDLPKLLMELEGEGLIKILSSNNYYGTPQRTFGISKADISPEADFDNSELSLVDKVNNSYKDLTPREISTISHSDFPYVATKNMGDVIDYKLTAYRDEGGESQEELDTEGAAYFASKTFSDLMEKVDNRLVSNA